MNTEKKTITHQATIYYFKPEFSRVALFGVDFMKEVGQMPTVATLETTHVELTTVSIQCGQNDGALDMLFRQFQAENWSPNGEARPLIEQKGLWHTSMCVGDVIKFDDGSHFICDSFGWVKLQEK